MSLRIVAAGSRCLWSSWRDPCHPIIHFFQMSEIRVVETLATGESPNPLDRDRLQTLTWQVVEHKSVNILLSPSFVKPGLLLRGLPGDHHDPVAGAHTETPGNLHEGRERFGIEPAPLAAKAEPASRSRTAPKYLTRFRVGRCRQTGSLVSGGARIRRREPCCWKCASSVAPETKPIRALSKCGGPSAPRAV